MDLINEYEKEIKELKKQKESIEKLSEQSANLKVERDKKKQGNKSIYKKGRDKSYISGFYRSFRGAYHSCGRQSRRNT